jgi:hypothetical protein
LQANKSCSCRTLRTKLPSTQFCHLLTTNTFDNLYKTITDDLPLLIFQCSEKSGISWAAVDSCMKSTAGTALQLMAQEETLKLAPLGLGFVPTITFNKVRKTTLRVCLEVDRNIKIKALLRSCKHIPGAQLSRCMREWRDISTHY